MKKKLFLFSAVVLSSAMMSCSSSEEEVDLGEAKAIVNMLSEPQPIELTQGQSVFAYDNNNFTLNFLKTVNEVDKSGKSFIYSPLSITYVLGMVNAAATGQTEQELEQTLGFHEGGIQAVNDSLCKPEYSHAEVAVSAGYAAILRCQGRESRLQIAFNSQHNQWLGKRSY